MSPRTALRSVLPLAAVCLLPWLLAAPAAAQVFANPTRIDVANATEVGDDVTPGIANLYPSPISVVGLTPGTPYDVTVRLNGLFAASLYDLNFLLVAPSGQAVPVLFGGGQSVGDGTAIRDPDSAPNIPALNYSFRDGGEAFPTGSTVDSVPPTSVIYRPTVADLLTNDSLPAPAPQGPYNLATTLREAAGNDPNGTWRLFVADFGPDDGGGGLANGWSLEFAVIPEPGTAPLVGTAGAGLLLGLRIRRRRRRCSENP